MAIIGETLINPESGWKRIEDIDTNFTYEGTWASRSNSAYSGSSQKTQANNILGNKIKFQFYGSKIRIISSLYPSYTPKVKITIDGNEERYTLQGDSTNMALVYEKLNLPLGLHYVEVEKIENGGYSSDFFWDAVEIDDNGYIADVNFSFTRLVIKSPIKDEYYSLSDKTLIHMPDIYKESMIVHALKQGKEIQLDVPFTKHKYINLAPIRTSEKERVFKFNVDNTKIKNFKEEGVYK